MQDLPIEPDAILSHADMDDLIDYCVNSDIPATERNSRDARPGISTMRKGRGQPRPFCLTLDVPLRHGFWAVAAVATSIHA